MNKKKRKKDFTPAELEKMKLMGEKMKEAREKAGLTQKQLAGLAILDPNYYATVERGEENISFTRLTRVEKVLGIKILNI